MRWNAMRCSVAAALLLRHVHGQVNHPARVAELVVVPRHQLHEVVVERNRRLRVVHGRVGRVQQVARHERLLRVLKDAPQLVRRGSLLDRGVDLRLRRTLLQAHRQVHDRDVRRRHAERHARQLAVQLRDHLADSLGRTRGRRDDVVEHRPATTPVLRRRGVHDLLRARRRVHRRHQTLHNAEVVVQHLRQRGEAVRRARRVGDHLHVRLEARVVHAHHEHRRVRRRRGDHNALGTTLEMRGGGVNLGEDTSRLHDVVGAGGTPRDVSGVALLEDGDGLAVDDELAVLRLDGAVEAAVHGVVLEHVHHVVHRDERVVHGDNGGGGVLQSRAQNETADAAESVDADGDHCECVGVCVLAKIDNEVQIL
eukprot:Rhum_TRINITY_DN14979_c10_g4::Rhum_TRINITY_DN14979_c10_g4_i3::g.131894::m.131894